MKLSLETRGALRRYGQLLAPLIGFAGTCVGIASAFRLIANGTVSDARVVVLSLAASVGASLLIATLALAGCLLYERARSRRAA